MGYRFIETDVHTTKDGRLVCIHDATLDRLAGIHQRVSHLTASDLTGVKIGDQPLAFFDDVVDAFPETRFNVDLKTGAAIRPLAELIQRRHLERRVLVASFSTRRISQFRRLTSNQVPTATATLGAIWTTFIAHPASARLLRASAVQIPATVRVGPRTVPVLTPSTIARVHRLGKVVHAWTIDDPNQMNHLIDLGVDGLITDRPDLLKTVLINRGLWETP